MANLEQIKIQIDKLQSQKDERQIEIEKHQTEIQKLQEEKDALQKKIDNLTGSVEEEADAAITTTSVGNASVYGGRANFAPKIGMTRRTTKKKKKNENKIYTFIDSVFE